MNYICLNKKERNSTKIKIVDGVPVIYYPILEKYQWLTHGFSTRIGGVSKDHLSQLNLGLERDDDYENVVKNHEIIANAIGFDPKSIVTSHQTHTNNIKIVSKKDCGKGLYFPREFNDIDGLITKETNVSLATYFADCVPLYIVDTKNRVIGLAHSGWRGTVLKIGKCVIEKMIEEYNTNPKDIVACIGPSICVDCYEIDKKVADEFTNTFSEKSSDILIEKDNGKFLLDLWECNKIIFEESGVPLENIIKPDLCTCCNTEYLFSHRGHNGMRGNLAAFLTINEL